MAGPEPTAAKAELEEGLQFTPQFDRDGLVPAVATDADTGAALMLAWMNADALAATLASGLAHFYSRSRKRLWRKGEESGNLLRVIEMRTDCDQDAIWLSVRLEGLGVACHTGRRSCFYRIVRIDDGTPPTPARLVLAAGEPLSQRA